MLPQNAPNIRTPSQAEFALFQKLILEKTGIHLPTTKIALLSSRIGKRLQARACESFRDYFSLISQKAEFAELELALNQITTNETYFFREQKHFDFLADHLLPSHPRNRTFKAWSAACSIGSEPYSTAMILENYGVPWEVVGSDINSAVLEHARNAIYPIAEMERIPSQLRRKYCLLGEGEYANRFRVAPEIRMKVRFFQKNLLHDNTQMGQFDLVLLRNVMIYFEKETQQKIIQKLERSLQPGGYLFIGHSETLHGISTRFNPVKPAIYRLGT